MNYPMVCKDRFMKIADSEEGKFVLNSMTSKRQSHRLR